MSYLEQKFSREILTSWCWFTLYHLDVRITQKVLVCMSKNIAFKIEYIFLQLFLHPVEATFSHVLSFSCYMASDVGVPAHPCLHYFKKQVVLLVLAKSWPWSELGILRTENLASGGTMLQSWRSVGVQDKSRCFLLVVQFFTGKTEA